MRDGSVLRNLHDAAAASRTLADLSRDVMPALLRVADADDGSIFRFAPGGAQFAYAAGTECSKGRMGTEWFETHAANDPHFRANAARNLPIDRATAQVTAIEAEPTLREFWGPLGLRDWLITRFGDTPVNTVGHSGVILFRRERGAWKERDAELFAPINDLLTRTVARVVDESFDAALLEALLAELVPGAQVVFDATGNVRWMSEDATRRFGLTALSHIPADVREGAIALAKVTETTRAIVASRDGAAVELRRLRIGHESHVLARFPALSGAALLSPRERQVVELIVSGHHPKLAAHELGIAHATVRVLLSRAMAKLGARRARDLEKAYARQS